MMRQAGRHIKEYRELVKTYPTFRERSEIADVAVEISLQPWRNYQTDGCILFSDILTPLPGMGVDFAIDEKVGPVMEPIRTYEEAKKVSDDGGPNVYMLACNAPIVATNDRPFRPDRRR
jgi:uroporphyrinogen decarboxylase